MPRAVFEQVGGWPAEFRFAHEGIDLAWRVMDAGCACVYAGDVAARPPGVRDRRRTTTPPTTAPATACGSRAAISRCRWRSLYVAGFMARTLPLMALARELRAAARGYRDGMRGPCGPRAGRCG